MELNLQVSFLSEISSKQRTFYALPIAKTLSMIYMLGA